MNAMQALLGIMSRLRSADGCPWDREQTFSSLAPYAIEEAHEVVDAIERGDLSHLKEELGDLLFQVVFHAELAREAGHFDFNDVATTISDKLVRRHPQVFARQTDAVRPASWEDIKAGEREAARAAMALASSAGRGSALDGVPPHVPALMRAVKLSQRAARVGFDFQHSDETADKVAEELAEVREAAAIEDDSARSSPLVEELGDLLFAVANLARKLAVDPETALRAANRKFERRFRGMETLAEERGLEFGSLALTLQEALWQEVKRAE